jgi:prepilin-type N-terminal cleavage/methylation domain-containing protein
MKEHLVMQKNTTRKSAFTLVEIMIVVAIIGLLASIAIPNFIKARNSSQTNACVNNLRQIDAAKQQWALEQNQAATASPTAATIQPYLGHGAGGSLPSCPLDTSRTFATSYNINALNTAPTCIPGGTNHMMGAY